MTKENGYEIYIGMYDRLPIENSEYRNMYLDNFDDTLRTYFNISYENLGELDGYREICTCEHPSSHIMYTTQYDPELLILCGDCGGVVPLYKLPCLEPYEEEHLYLLSWQKGYRAGEKRYVQSWRKKQDYRLTTIFLSAAKVIKNVLYVGIHGERKKTVYSISLAINAD